MKSLSIFADIAKRLGVAPLGQVLCDLGKAAKDSFRVISRRHHYPRPKLGSVLAHPPAFVLGAANFSRNRQLGPRFARLQCLGKVEARKMRPYYLGRFVAFDSARAGVPAGDQAIRVSSQ